MTLPSSLKRYGAISAKGAIIEAVQLSEADEVSLSTELLLQLAQAGVIR